MSFDMARQDQFDLRILPLGVVSRFLQTTSTITEKMTKNLLNYCKNEVKSY